MSAPAQFDLSQTPNTPINAAPAQFDLSKVQAVPIGATTSPNGGQPPNTGGVSGSWPSEPTIPNAILHPVQTVQQSAEDWSDRAAYQQHADVRAGKSSPGFNIPVLGRVDKSAIEGMIGDAQQFIAAPFSSWKNAAITAGAILPGTDIPTGLYLVGKGTQLATAPRAINEDHPAYVQRVLTGLSMVAGGAGGAAKGGAETDAQIKILKARRAQAKEATFNGLARIRDAGAVEARSALLNGADRARTNLVSQKVEAINQADQAAISKGAPLADIRFVKGAVEAAKNIYQQIPLNRPGSAANLKTLEAAPDAMTFEQMKQLRGALFNARLLVSDPDQGAIITNGYDALTKAMEQRAANLGKHNEFLDYNENNVALKGKEFDSSLGPILDKIRNVDNGSDLWELFNNQKYRTQLETLQNSLEQHGLIPKDFLENIKRDYAATEQALISAGKSNNFMGILKSIVHHPVRSIPTYLAGHAAGGFVGGYVALGAMNEIAEQANMTSLISKHGALPEGNLLINRGPSISGGATIGERLAEKGQTPPKVGGTEAVTSARRAEMQTSSSKLGPEFADQERSYLSSVYKKVLQNPDATAEEKSIATSQLADLTKSEQNPAPSTGRGVAAVEQGGHAGGGVASVEELARPGRFVKISRSGVPSDMGKSPDFGELKPGEAGYQVKPDGTYELRTGQESPVTKLGVEKYAKEVYGAEAKKGTVNVEGEEYQIQPDGSLEPLEAANRQNRVRETVDVSKKIEKGERELERLKKMKAHIGPSRYEEAVAEISKMLDILRAQVEH